MIKDKNIKIWTSICAEQAELDRGIVAINNERGMEEHIGLETWLMRLVISTVGEHVGVMLQMVRLLVAKAEEYVVAKCKRRWMVVGCLFLLQGVWFKASAQRTISGQYGVTLSGAFTGTSVGAGAFCMRYSQSGFWEWGMCGNGYRAILSTGQGMQYGNVVAMGGYLWRIAGMRNRRVSVYAGGGGMLGVEVLDPWRRLPGYVDIGRNKATFMYGLYGHAQVEVFVARRFALVAEGMMPVNFSPCIGHVHWQAGLGCKFLFY